ncbi:pilus assembly protein PilM [Candidatus Pelagibacter sp.]|nr:pilus assembly protein PilM [Candidatus Pelagibacter sp.]
MDDKEKEKFGVVIEKEKQPEGDHSKVEEKTLESENLTPKTENNDFLEKKQPENENKPDESNQETVTEENNENKTEESNQETVTEENNENKTEESNQETVTEENNENNNDGEKKEHEVIHKKDGRLHIYVRQDKYKGELKSKNWVGRLYIDGKQKISSSGTPNLEEAIPILEKWFDDIHEQKEKEKEQKNLEETSTTQETSLSQQTAVTEVKTVSPAEVAEQNVVPTKEVVTESQKITTQEKATNIASSFLDKVKNIKLKKPDFGKKDSASKVSNLAKGNFRKKIESFFKSKIGKSAVQGEEIVGVEITNKEIRLAQISSNKANQWILDKFFVHKVDLPDDAAVLDNADKMGEELSLALQKAKITTPNAAIAIPVTSAIIRVVTAPLMKDEELQKAIETNSLWENLVQLTDNLDDYSIFHQVINKNEKENTMDILFVASKLADINNYTSIINKSNLNPVIIDVKCFALKSAVDQINQIAKNAEDTNLTAVLEFGLDENYLMILYDNNPIITDIFLRGQDRQILLASENQEEKEALVRRFITQVKQAVQDFEVKYEKRIRNIKVVSDLKNVEDFLSVFRKSMVNVGFNLFDPIQGLNVPHQNQESLNLQNRSYLSSVIGLAFRKLDVFGYYKFVTAVKNINLLPNRAGMIKQKKMKAFSKFAFKGVAGAVLVLYTVLFGLSFWQIYSYNSKLVDYNKVVKEHKLKTAQKKKVSKELGVMSKTLQLSKTLKSNKSLSYRILAQIAMSVPKRVRFSSIAFDGGRTVIIMGAAATDQDILKLINNLNNQKLVQQASLTSMTLPKSKSGTQNKKGFKILVKVKG